MGKGFHTNYEGVIQNIEAAHAQPAAKSQDYFDGLRDGVEQAYKEVISHNAMRKAPVPAAPASPVYEEIRMRDYGDKAVAFRRWFRDNSTAYYPNGKIPAGAEDLAWGGFMAAFRYLRAHPGSASTGPQEVGEAIQKGWRRLLPEEIIQPGDMIAADDGAIREALSHGSVAGWNSDLVYIRPSEEGRDHEPSI
jgi:hypothetical protein